MKSTPLFVGIDVGGQTIKGGVVDGSGRPLSSVSVPTEAAKGQEHGLEQMCQCVRAAVSEAKLRLEDIDAIGVATPGTMDIPAGLILDPPNLKPWRNVPVRDHVHKAFGKPTAFQNDANAAAYGEYWAGAGRGVRSLVLFTLGTGIGCGIIVNDFILEGEHSHGAEVGHVIIDMRPDARVCGCGGAGHLEAYASATAVVKRARELLDRNADEGRSLLRDALRANGGLTARDVFDAACRDPIAAKLVDETAYYLSVGAVCMMHTIDPDMVVFGGGMTACGVSFLDLIRGYVQKLAFPVPAQKTRIVYAQLGTDAGFIGAAGCARQLYHRTDRR